MTLSQELTLAAAEAEDRASYWPPNSFEERLHLRVAQVLEAHAADLDDQTEALGITPLGAALELAAAYLNPEES